MEQPIDEDSEGADFAALGRAVIVLSVSVGVQRSESLAEHPDQEDHSVLLAYRAGRGRQRRTGPGLALENRLDVVDHWNLGPRHKHRLSSQSCSSGRYVTTQ